MKPADHLRVALPRLGVALFAMLMLAVPPGAAQDQAEATLTLSWLSAPEPAVVPPGGLVVQAHVLHVQCPFGSAHVEQPRVDVAITDESDDGVAHTLDRTVFAIPVGPSDCTFMQQAEGWVREFTVNVSSTAAPNAAAFLLAGFTLEATSDTATSAVSDVRHVQVGFAGGFEVEAVNETDARRGERLQFPITIRNTGNADLRVDFRLEEDVAEVHRRVAGPGPQIILAATNGRAVLELPIDMQTTTEGQGRIDESFTLLVSAISAHDPKQTLPPERLVFTVHVDGAYIDTSELPAAHLALQAALCVGLVVGLRQRR